jgi:hypothetical protein
MLRSIVSDRGFHMHLRRPSAPTLIALLALFFALGGTAIAAPRHPVKHSSHRRSPRRVAIAHAAIIGGAEAETGTYPWMAFIFDNRGEQYGVCSGTVVSPNVILTAGHCAENVETGVVREPSSYSVVTGNVAWPASPRQVLSVSRVVVYPSFDPTLLTDDAALLILSIPTTAPSIPLASYPADSGRLEVGTVGIMAGWGNTYFGQEVPTERLRHGATVVQRTSYCENNARPFYGIYEICAIDPPSYQTSACNGDSGGPLITFNPSEEGDMELGIVSHGFGECSTEHPTVFTRTDVIAPWVNEWISTVKPPSEPAQAPSAAPTPAQQTSTPSPPPIEGVYRGVTSQEHAKIGVVIGSGGRRLTAIATTVTYRCRSGHSFSEPLEGLSNGEPESITASHTFTVNFAYGAENETVSGAIDQAHGEITGTLTSEWRTHRYGLCSTGLVSWTAQRSAAAASTAALTSPGDYDGRTNQNDRITVTVAPNGRQLSGLEFSAKYACPRHHSIHLTFSPSDSEAIEGFGTFTVHLGGHDYSGRIDGTFGLTLNSAFGTLEASTVTRYGHCHTGVIPWWASAPVQSSAAQHG